MTPPKRLNYIIFIYLSYILKFTDSARILCIYPVPFHSHQYVFRALTEELAKRGHELVVLTPLPTKTPIENVTQIDVHEISYKVADEGMAQIMKDRKSPYLGPIEFWTDFVFPTIPAIVQAQYTTKEMQDLINDKEQKFDLLLIEACVPVAIMARIRFEAPVILVSSLLGCQYNYQVIGTSRHPWYFPDFSIQKIHELSLWDKISALYTTIKLQYVTVNSFDRDNEVIRKVFGPEAPTLQELHKHVEMLFLNSHQIWDNNRPVPPSVIYMGALHLKEPKALPKELEKFLENSQRGVIYMSMGSKILVSALPPHVVKMFFNVFAKLPYDILLKWNGNERIEKPKNVRFEKWLPQNDLLHHPKLKAFITHGGLQSTDEAIAAKIPLVGIPFMCDQFYNVQQYVKHGIGEQILMDHMTETELEKAILNVAEDKKYRKNLASLLKIMEVQRQGGLEKAAFWAEYVAKEGAQKLRSPLADSYITQQYIFEGIFLLGYFTIWIVFLISALKLFSLLSLFFEPIKEKLL